MSTAPDLLAAYGTSVDLPTQTVTITPTPGPALPLRMGTLTIGDPWWPEYPDGPIELLGQGEHPTLLSTIVVDVERLPDPVAMSCAAAVGPVDQVVSWQPVLHDEEHFHLDCDSGLGAFFDINDEEILKPLFTDDLHMQQVYNRALEERVVTMEADGRVVAVRVPVPRRVGPLPGVDGVRRHHAGRRRPGRPQAARRRPLTRQPTSWVPSRVRA